MKFIDNSSFGNVTPIVTHKTMPLLASQGLPVAAAHRTEKQILDGREVRVVVADWNVPERRECWPVHEPCLAEDFARVTDEPSLKEFNGRYGLLGFDCLHRTADSKETWKGDPVPWAVAHARVAAGILGAVAVINQVRSGKVELNDRSIRRYLLPSLRDPFGKIGVEGLLEGEPRRFAGFAWTPPEALITPNRFQLQKRFSSRWGNDPIGTSYIVLSWVLNQYIRRVRFEFVSGGYAERFFGLADTGPRFGPEFHWDALLQVIYWQLAERVGGAFRQCPRCGRIFPMSTGKDKYCSRHCSDAMRSKRYRVRKKEPKKRGKKNEKPKKRRNR